MGQPDPATKEAPSGTAPTERPGVLDGRYLVRLVLLALAYVATARLGLGLDAYGGFAALVWPPSGIALAALVLGGTSLWPAVFVGAVLGNLGTGAPLLAILGVGVGNTLQAVVGVWLFRALRIGNDFCRVRDVFGLLAVTFVTSAVSAAIGPASLQAGGSISLPLLPSVAAAWWLGDVLGTLIVTPFLLVWSMRPRPRAERWWLEAAGLVLATVATGLVVFFDRAEILLPTARAYELFPVLIWAAMRFGPPGATATLIAVAAMAVWGTALHHGPFVESTLGFSLASLQAFMTVAAVTTLLLAAAAAERDTMLQEKAREELLAVVSHDLKNPLHTIRLSAAALLKQPADQVGERARPQLEVIQKATSRMSALIHRLLEEASLRVGEVRLDRRREDLVALVQDAVDLVRPSMLEKAATLRVEVPPKVEVQVDRERILQVLSNLLGNAIKFTPEHGTVVAQVEVHGNCARCSITDSGPGLEPEQLRHVFEPYWTGDPSQGTGLGLSISKRLIEAHGGQMWFHSRPGAGSTVGFSVPLA